MAVPTRSTAQPQVDAWNAQMRQSPAYLAYMQSQGLPTNGRVTLSRAQQEGLERALAAAGMPVPSGMHIDQGGNLNQKNRLVRNTAIAAGVAAGGYVAAPYIAGALATGGAGGGAAAGATAGTAGATSGASGVGAAAATGGGFWSGLSKFIGSNVGGQLLQTGGQIAGNVMQSRANDRAGEALERAAREALDWEKEVYAKDEARDAEALAFRRSNYDTEMRDFAPYQAAGGASIARLSDMTGQRRDPVSAAGLFRDGDLSRSAPPQMPRATVSGMRSAGAGQTPAAQARTPEPVPIMNQRREGVSTTMPVPIDQGRRLGPATSGLDAGASAGLVTMQAPTGKTFHVSPDKVAFYEKQGARRAA